MSNESQYDIIVDIYFLTTKEGGRAHPLAPKLIGFPFRPDNEKYREQYGGINHFFESYIRYERWVYPGETLMGAKVKFLWPEGAMPFLSVGTKFILWDRREFARGIIIEIAEDQK